MAARPERRDLERDPGILGRLDQVLELRPEHLPAADRPPQCRLVHDGPQARAALLGEQLLPGDPDADAALYLLLGSRGPAAGHDGPGVARRLKQPGNELDLVDPQHRRGLLEAHVGLKPIW